MNKAAQVMTDRIHRALQSGKLKHGTTYPIPALVIILGTTRLELTAAVNRKFGSIAQFYQQACLAVVK